jgi:hypothetical protein
MELAWLLEASVQNRISFAMQQNSIPIFQEIVIANNTEEQADDLELSVVSSPEFCLKHVFKIARIIPGQRYHVKNINIDLDPGVLSRLTESEKGVLQFRLNKNGEELSSLSIGVELLARNEWGGAESFPELACAFVQPNDPAVQHLLGKSADILRENRKAPSLDGYQRGKSAVWEQVAALWSAVCAQRIGYALPPASFELAGQKVRHPSQIVETRIGTCLDLSTLFASCLEQCGLNPLLVFIQGHCFVGCWLRDETFSASVVDDISALRKRLHLQELIFFESTLATQSLNQPPSFTWACKKGEEHLSEAKEAQFKLAVDIRRARMQRIRPLALAKALETPTGVEKTEETEHVAPPIEDAPRFDVEINDAAPLYPREALTRLERWQRRLLDLSLRNNLLNFRSGKRVVEFLVPDPGALEDKLADGGRFTLQSAEQHGYDPRDYNLHEERNQENLLRGLASDVFKRGALLAQLSRQEMSLRLLELYRTARNTLDEGGANTLFLALGFLNWKPTDREKPCKAPLVLLPVKLERRSVQSGFSLSMLDDEPRFNLTLLHMLREDYAIDSLSDFERELPKYSARRFSDRKSP